jgi:hypothetical protein
MSHYQKGDDMMKRLIMLILIMTAALLVVACGAAAVTPDEPPADAQPAPDTDEGIMPRPTVTTDASPGDDAYPMPVQPEPETDYPAPETMPTYDPYPAVAGYVWVVHPFGEQCEDGRFYENVDAAVTALEDADIEVDRGTTVNLNVCLACGCPTSEHYRLHIAEADLEKAEALGWELYRE